MLVLLPKPTRFGPLDSRSKVFLFPCIELELVEIVLDNGANGFFANSLHFAVSSVASVIDVALFAASAQDLRTYGGCDYGSNRTVAWIRRHCKESLPQARITCVRFATAGLPFQCQNATMRLFR
jgi:hypothetical protein